MVNCGVCSKSIDEEYEPIFQTLNSATVCRRCYMDASADDGVEAYEERKRRRIAERSEY